MRTLPVPAVPKDLQGLWATPLPRMEWRRVREKRFETTAALPLVVGISRAFSRVPASLHDFDLGGMAGGGGKVRIPRDQRSGERLREREVGRIVRGEVVP